MNTIAKHAKSDKNYIVTLIWQEVERFIEDWQDSPYEWNTEIDIQAELASRLTKIFKSKTMLVAWLSYKDVKDERFKNSQRYRRICCEYPVYYYNESGKRARCYPDIVVYDTVGDTRNPPDNEPGINFPMLWVCEIKYETEWGGDFQGTNRKKDLWKLRRLLFQRSDKTIYGTEYACFLDLYRNKVTISEKNGVYKSAYRNRLRRYTVKLPKDIA